MQFLSDYMLASQGTSVPPRFQRWGAMALLSMTLGRRTFVDHGRYQIYPTLYLCLVGVPASKKSVTKDDVKDMFMEVWPGFPIGASITTPEAIVKRLTQQETLRSFKNHLGIEEEYRPLYFFINEFSNFLRHNPEGMIEMLTDIYDTRFYDSETLKHGLEPVINPLINIFACTTPDKFISTFKHALVGGGFSRRLLPIYEDILPKPVTFPVFSPESRAARMRCVEHLRSIKELAGEFTWTDEARRIFSSWYENLESPRDPILEGYYSTKDIFVQKLAMCLGVSFPTPRLKFDTEIIETAIALAESNEENMHKLTFAAGRNELNACIRKLLDVLKHNKGVMPETEFHKAAAYNFTESEYVQTKLYLKTTAQVFESLADLKDGLGAQPVIMLPEIYKALKAKLNQ